MDMFNPMEDPREEIDPLTGQPRMPNVPRDPENPREKLMSYLSAKMESDKKMMTPEYRQQMRAPTNALMDNSRDLALANVFLNAANQAGSIDGKIASSASTDAAFKNLQGLNQQAMQGIDRERAGMQGAENEKMKIMQYLADKFDANKAREASLGIQRDRLAFDMEDRKRQQGNLDRQYGLDKERLEIERGKNANNSPQKKALQGQSEAVGKKVTDLSGVRSEIASALRQLKDPNISNDDKIRIAQGLVKTINMTQGTSDAIGAEEVGRLASELQSSLESVGKGVMVGAGSAGTAGAAIGGGLGAAAGGVGAVPGAAIGGGIGALGGGLVGALGATANEMAKPGGFRLSPDVEGFTSRAQRALEKVDSTIARQSRLQELILEGKSVPEANAIIDREIAEAQTDW